MTILIGLIAFILATNWVFSEVLALWPDGVLRSFGSVMQWLFLILLFAVLSWCFGE
jgi:hypothetical protein